MMMAFTSDFNLRIKDRRCSTTAAAQSCTNWNLAIKNTAVQQKPGRRMIKINFAAAFSKSKRKKWLINCELILPGFLVYDFLHKWM
jgi:hypothetical protein